MKRQAPNWPKEIVEVPSDRVDPRADPAATQRISRALLEDALQRTKSGTRPALREGREGADRREGADAREEPEGVDLHEPFFGPRDSYVDDSPRVTITGLESTPPGARSGLAVSWPPTPGTPHPVPRAPGRVSAQASEPGSPEALAPVPPPPVPPQPLLAQVTPAQGPLGNRVLLLVVVSLVAFFAAAATIGFVAGRLTHH